MLSINMRNLLWSTRGKQWGFRFVYKPESHRHYLDAIYQNVFGLNDVIPCRWYGYISLPDGTKFPYVASRFFDPRARWTDASGREIPHEMLLDVGANLPERVSRRKWEIAVMDSLRNYYEQIYHQYFAFQFSELQNEVKLPLCCESARAINMHFQLSEEAFQENIKHRYRAATKKILSVLKMDVREIYMLLSKKFKALITVFPRGGKSN